MAFPQSIGAAAHRALCCGSSSSAGLRLLLRSASENSSTLGVTRSMSTALRPTRLAGGLALGSQAPTSHSGRIAELLRLRPPQAAHGALAVARARMAHSTAPARAPPAVAMPAPDADVGLSGNEHDRAHDGADTGDQDAKIPLTHPAVAAHLFVLAGLVYAIVVVGGLTRLTESGLSITEWNPGFKGMHLPSTDEEWHAEWDKYKRTPEFIVLNQRMSLEDFKSIYMWEWAHRVLGRVIGVAFILPAAFFVARPGWVAPGTRWKLLAIGAGIGFQGALGWFMVQSGLTAPGSSTAASPQAQALAAEGIVTPIPSATHDARDLHSTVSTSDPNWHPRVSHFRLAAHLGTAFLVYLGMIHTGFSVLRDWKLAHNQGTVSGVPLSSGSAGEAAAAPRERLVAALNHPLVRKYARTVRLLGAFVFVTAMSGALVAGLDAGLIYNEWPTMGGDGRFAPPADELMDPRYGLRSGSDSDARQRAASSGWRLWVGNTFTNPATVQLVHRTLATTSFLAVLGLAWKTRSLRRALASAGPVATQAGTSAVSTTAASGARASAALSRVSLPPLVPRLAALACAAVTLQASLGITTLLYLVPIPLASAHQAGSLLLLTVLTALSVSVRRPSAALERILRLGGSAGREWREDVRRKALARVAVRA